MAENEAPIKQSAWEKFWTKMLPPELQLILATTTVLATIVIMAWVGINEPARMEEFASSYQARSIENGAVIFDSNCRGCHGPQGQGIEGVAPALNRPELFDGTRLEEVGWTGTLEDFIQLTVAAGRPTSRDYPNPMPTWGQEFGGPLRPDQVRDVTNFILNWEESALAGEAPEAGQPPSEEEAAERFVGTDLERELPEGDPERGQALFESNLGCSGCHVAGAGTVAPDIQGVATRASERVPGMSAEAYIRESIQTPCAFLADDFTCAMPQNFGERLTPQDLADIIAYLLTLD